MKGLNQLTALRIVTPKDKDFEEMKNKGQLAFGNPEPDVMPEIQLSFKEWEYWTPESEPEDE